jgi:phage gp45-like
MFYRAEIQVFVNGQLVDETPVTSMPEESVFDFQCRITRYGGRDCAQYGPDCVHIKLNGQYSHHWTMNCRHKYLLTKNLDESAT